MISTKPYKGTKDYYPDDMLLLDYIFRGWKEVCLSHGFLEYHTPIIENAEIYEAKSGEDIGGKELYKFQDQGGRNLCLRPEMTPSVTRIVSAKYKEMSKPIKLFNIGSFYRQEKPQKGRMREFWQLNVDIFGDESLGSELEIFSLLLDLMKKFQAPENSYVIKVSHRQLLNSFLDELKIFDHDKISVVRLLDKINKLPPAVFKEEILKIVDEDIFHSILKFMNADFQNLTEIFPEAVSYKGYRELQDLFNAFFELKMSENIEYSPSLVRGFDYYDGVVFEVFDKNLDNPRSLFGGGRYNGLASVFGGEDFPALGFAPGNETFAIFLENWNLIPEKSQLRSLPEAYIFAIHQEEVKNIENVNIKSNLNRQLQNEVFEVASKIRNFSHNLILDSALSTKSISAGLDYASKKGYQYALIIGPDEKEKSSVTLKILNSGQQMLLSIESLLNYFNNHLQK